MVLIFCFSFTAGRLFKKIELNESIRYASGDPIERWLNELLCLDVANYIPNITRLTYVTRQLDIIQSLVIYWLSLPRKLHVITGSILSFNQVASSQRM